MKNREFRNITTAGTVIILAAVLAAAALAGIKAGLITLLSGALLLAVFVIYTKKRYRQIGELDDYLRQQDHTKEDMLSYSKFLYKLEQDQGITEDEREAYIGIYRLVRQIEKADFAPVGAIDEMNAAFNFENLLSALRSRKHKPMDYRVDDSFGGMSAVDKGIASIVGGIEMGQHCLMNAVQSNLMFDDGTPMDPRLPDGLTGWIADRRKAAGSGRVTRETGMNNPKRNVKRSGRRRPL